MDSATFAAARGARLDQHDEDLEPVVAKALSSWSASADWYEDIVEGASVLWSELYSESAGEAGEAQHDALLKQFQVELRKTLAQTGDPDQAAATQARTITYWVSTYTANNAEMRAQRFNGHPNLEWVTRDDSHVRPVHAAIDGQVRPSGQKFDLGGGVHLAYPGEPDGPLEYWINCRCLLRAVSKELTMALTAAVPVDLETDDEDAPVDAGVYEQDLVDVPMPVPFHGIAAPTGVPSGDGRQLETNGYSTRNLPLPLNYQRGSYHGGDPGQAVTVGRIDAIWLDNQTGLVHYAGVYVPAIPESAEAIQHVVDGTMTGVSVDVDNSVMEQLDPDTMSEDELAAFEAGRGLTKFTSWRIAGITQVAIPAFQEAKIQLGEHPDMSAPTNPAEVALAASVDAFGITSNPGTHDGPGWLTAPVPTGRIRRYWTEGKGKAKIAWGVAGDFDRCRAHLGKYVDPRYLAGTCANMHKEATGAWPGHAPGELHASLVAAGARMAESVRIVNDALDSVLPKAFFENPSLSAPTPFTVDVETGRVYGHVATWGTCHIGYKGVCTTAPESFSNYAYFRTGAVTTDEGDVAVGHITMDGHHAPMKANAQTAMGHYDNTTAVVADVAAGEDPFGIWVAGALRPGLDADKVRALKAAALSGDWRSIGGNLEMVAALAVNVPGFPIPRTSLAASGEHQESLTAAGIVTQKEQIIMATPPIPPKKKPEDGAPAGAPKAPSDSKPAGDAAPKAPAAPKPDMPDMPAAPEATAPPTEKPLGPGDEAVNSAVETIHSALSGMASNFPEGSEEGTKFAELMVTVNDLVKYLGLDKPEPVAEPQAITAAAVMAMVRREVQVGARRDAAKAILRKARADRARRFHVGG